MALVTRILKRMADGGRVEDIYREEKLYETYEENHGDGSRRGYGS